MEYSERGKAKKKKKGERREKKEEVITAIGNQNRGANLDSLAFFFAIHDNINAILRKDQENNEE